MNLCVPCTAPCKHFISSLRINASNSIFRLVHIPNVPMLIILTPLHLPCMPSINYAHLFVDHVNSSVGCGNTSTHHINKFDDYTNTPDDWVNTFVNIVDTLDRLSSNLWIPNPSVLQLLFTNLLIIYRSKINIVLIVGSFICSSSLILYIYDFCISQSSSSSSISKFSAWTPLGFCSQYTGIYCSCFWTSNSMYL